MNNQPIEPIRFSRRLYTTVALLLLFALLALPVTIFARGVAELGGMEAYAALLAMPPPPTARMHRHHCRCVTSCPRVVFYRRYVITPNGI